MAVLAGMGLSACGTSDEASNGQTENQSGSAGQAQAGSTTAGTTAQTAGSGGASAGSSATVAGSAGQSSGMAGGGSGAGGSSTAGSSATGGGGGSGGDPSKLDKFSFFATSMKKMIELGGPKGFGGDLRFGMPTGLEGADKICTTIAESSMPGSGAKQWHAFLSTEHGGPNDGPIHAKDRIGQGPWYDRIGRVVSMNLTNLLKERPSDADAAIKEDLPNEDGVPNKRPDPTKDPDDTHHFLTGSKASGEWYGKDLHQNSSTCLDWTTNGRKNIASSNEAGDLTGRPQIGFSFSVDQRRNWISGQTEGGCGAGITGVGTVNGGSQESNPIVGSGGGYGGIYCFAMVP